MEGSNHFEDTSPTEHDWYSSVMLVLLGGMYLYGLYVTNYYEKSTPGVSMQGFKNTTPWN